jgi:hypothetical protein
MTLFKPQMSGKAEIMIVGRKSRTQQIENAQLAMEQQWAHAKTPRRKGLFASNKGDMRNNWRGARQAVDYGDAAYSPSKRPAEWRFRSWTEAGGTAVAQQRDPQVHQKPEDLPQWGFGLETDLHGDTRGIRAVDDAGAALERGAEPLRHYVRGPLDWTH